NVPKPQNSSSIASCLGTSFGLAPTTATTQPVSSAQAATRQGRVHASYSSFVSPTPQILGLSGVVRTRRRETRTADICSHLMTADLRDHVFLGHVQSSA